MKQHANSPLPEAESRRRNRNADLSRQSIMNRTDFPYVVSLLFAFLSWSLAHAVDRLVELPLVKLTETVEQQADTIVYLTVEFENITSSINFENLTIRILGETPENRFAPPNTMVIGAGWDGEASLFEAGDGISLYIADFHPEWSIELTTTMFGRGMPRVQLEEADVPTILEPVGWRTRLVEWELYIIVLIACGALIFITLWARTQYRCL